LWVLSLILQTHSQGDRVEAPVEGTSLTDPYAIGPEDVLSIHVWKEEALTRTTPARTVGKI